MNQRDSWLLLVASALALISCRRAGAPETDHSPAVAKTTRGVTAQPTLDSTPSPAPNYLPSAVSGMLRIDDKAYFFTPGKWEHQPGKSETTIPVCWEPGVPNGPERGWVTDAVTQSWQKNSALRFVGYINCAPTALGLRIAVRDDGPRDGPHTIELGRFLDGKPSGMVLNFTFNTWSPACKSSLAQRESCIRSIAVHEFGHAIGFAHEQNRPDTPGECTMKPQGQNGDVMLTPWDIHSVMNYCNPVYNNDGHLSISDVAAVRRIYGE